MLSPKKKKDKKKKKKKTTTTTTSKSHLKQVDSEPVDSEEDDVEFLVDPKKLDKVRLASGKNIKTRSKTFDDNEDFLELDSTDDESEVGSKTSLEDFLKKFLNILKI